MTLELVGSTEVDNSILSNSSLFLRAEIVDDGPGIHPDLLDRVFDLFFTTKENRGGSGLGLSMVKGFANEAGGVVSAENAQPYGARFTLIIPVTEYSSEKTFEPSRGAF